MRGYLENILTPKGYLDQKGLGTTVLVNTKSVRVSKRAGHPSTMSLAHLPVYDGAHVQADVLEGSQHASLQRVHVGRLVVQ